MIQLQELLLANLITQIYFINAGFSNGSALMPLVYILKKKLNGKI